ncbi:FkbM family methyltransferase [Hymenobacter sp.]|uniref:FkbM family methyltransferase n=1 Tax=Hymenobacter sp. TaxID=1898978 RepID=UPI00286D17D0|nr:FkbM family methyltransferase [Hymenobacter sp.]
MSKMKTALHKQTVARYKYIKYLKSTGITFSEYCDYFYSNKNTGNDVTESLLYDKLIKRNNTFWFVQNVEEIFVDEVYKFVSNSDAPYIIDCGVNIGLSLIYFKKNHPKAKILGFEPDANVYNTCLNNLKSFGFEDIEVENAAVWKEDGAINFLPDNSLGGKIVDSADAGVTRRVNKIDAVRLNTYLNQKIDFLKIDIEGSELEVMRDCKNNLHHVENLFVEYHSPWEKPQELAELLTIMREAGFRYYIESAWNNMSHPFVEHISRSGPGYDLQLNIFAYRH